MQSLAYVIRTYSLPMVLALMVHALAVFALWRGWQVPDVTKLQLVKPVIVHASLVELESRQEAVERAPSPPVESAIRRRDEPAPSAARGGVAVPEKPKVLPVPDEIESTPEEAVEAERKRRAEERARDRAQIADWFDQALGNESALVEQVEVELASQSYLEAIANRVTENWSRPPSARNLMEVELLIELVPTGDVVGVTVVRSSGNEAFDRSAENAVWRSQRFDVPEDRQMFERNFRRFRVLFRPEDLMR